MNDSSVSKSGHVPYIYHSGHSYTPTSGHQYSGHPDQSGHLDQKWSPWPKVVTLTNNGHQWSPSTMVTHTSGHPSGVLYPKWSQWSHNDHSLSGHRVTTISSKIYKCHIHLITCPRSVLEENHSPSLSIYLSPSLPQISCLYRP